MIFDCLLELAEDVESQMGVIENVILAGLPSEIYPLERWARIRTLVSGRLVHCYSIYDWVLQYVYRGTSLSVGEIAGLAPIEGVAGVESLNLSELIQGHAEYGQKMTEILSLVNL